MGGFLFDGTVCYFKDDEGGEKIHHDYKGPCEILPSSGVVTIQKRSKLLVFPEYLYEIEEHNTNVKGFNAHDHCNLKGQRKSVMQHDIAGAIGEKFAKAVL
jgi:hypothetical protein